MLNIAISIGKRTKRISDNLHMCAASCQDYRIEDEANILLKETNRFLDSVLPFATSDTGHEYTPPVTSSLPVILRQLCDTVDALKSIDDARINNAVEDMAESLLSVYLSLYNVQLEKYRNAMSEPYNARRKAVYTGLSNTIDSLRSVYYNIRMDDKDSEYAIAVDVLKAIESLSNSLANYGKV